MSYYLYMVSDEKPEDVNISDLRVHPEDAIVSGKGNILWAIRKKVTKTDGGKKTGWKGWVTEYTPLAKYDLRSGKIRNLLRNSVLKKLDGVDPNKELDPIMHDLLEMFEEFIYNPLEAKTVYDSIVLDEDQIEDMTFINLAIDYRMYYAYKKAIEAKTDRDAAKVISLFKALTYSMGHNYMDALLEPISQE